MEIEYVTKNVVQAPMLGIIFNPNLMSINKDILANSM